MAACSTCTEAETLQCYRLKSEDSGVQSLNSKHWAPGLHNVGAVAVVQAVAPGAAVGQVAAAVVDLLEALRASACTPPVHNITGVGLCWTIDILAPHMRCVRTAESGDCSPELLAARRQTARDFGFPSMQRTK